MASGTQERVHLRHTTAERVYDYDGVIDLGDLNMWAATGKRFRLVAIPERTLERQEARYGSGLHVSLTHKLLAEWLDMGLVRLEAEATS